MNTDPLLGGMCPHVVNATLPKSSDGGVESKLVDSGRSPSTPFVSNLPTEQGIEMENMKAVYTDFAKLAEEKEKLISRKDGHGAFYAFAGFFAVMGGGIILKGSILSLGITFLSFSVVMGVVVYLIFRKVDADIRLVQSQVEKNLKNLKEDESFLGASVGLKNFYNKLNFIYGNNADNPVKISTEKLDSLRKDQDRKGLKGKIQTLICYQEIIRAACPGDNNLLKLIDSKIAMAYGFWKVIETNARIYSKSSKPIESLEAIEKEFLESLDISSTS